MAKSKKNNAAATSSLHLALINPNAAGLDVGSMNMVVSYPTPGNVQTVKEYGAFTGDLKQMSADLKAAAITHVGMEATGVYWMAVYELLEAAGFEVVLVNARNYRNVDGQKTDVQDSQWLQQLHAHGLLRASHIATEEYRELRTYIHERGIFQQQKSDTLNRIHKVLTQMNVKWQHVISDIEGVAGMQVIERIAAGVTDPEALLAGIRTTQLKSPKEELVRSLEGIYKPFLVKVLDNHLVAYRFFKERMLAYEGLIEALLERLLPPAARTEVATKTVKARKNEYHFNLREYLHRIVGVDLTEISGLEENTVLTIIAVVGLNMQKWATAEHFTSWLNLAARPRKSGGKTIGHQKRFTNNPATQAFRMAAQSMWKEKGPLGNLYRKLDRTKGSKKAVKAVARRLAVIFYNMVKKRTAYDPKIVLIDEEKQRAKKIDRLKKEAEKLGMKLVA